MISTPKLLSLAFLLISLTNPSHSQQGPEVSSVGVVNDHLQNSEVEVKTTFIDSKTRDSDYTVECQDELYIEIYGHSGKNYTRIKVIEESTGNVRQNSTTHNDPTNAVAGVNWLRRGKKYKVILYGRKYQWLLWSKVHEDPNYIFYPEGVSGNITADKARYCEDETITIVPNLNNNSSIGFMRVIKNGNSVFNTSAFNYNNSFDLRQVLSTPNKYGNTYNLTPGSYSVNFIVNEPVSACSKDIIVNFEIIANSVKAPQVTINSRKLLVVGFYLVSQVCNSRNNDGVLLRINRDIPLSDCERVEEKISVTISEFDTSTGISTNTLSGVYNFPYPNLAFTRLRDVFPSHSFKNDTLYKMVVSGQTFYLVIKNWRDCLTTSNQRLIRIGN